EQMLPKQVVAAKLDCEERQIECALQLKQDTAQYQWRKADQYHAGSDQHVPGKDRHATQAHARCAHGQYGGDQLGRSTMRQTFGKSYADGPDVSIDAWRVLRA